MEDLYTTLFTLGLAALLLVLLSAAGGILLSVAALLVSIVRDAWDER